MIGSAAARRATPPTTERVIAAYEVLLSRSTRMLARAREANWEALLDEIAHYVMAVEWLADHERDVVLDADQKAYKAELLERILEHDTEMRRRLAERHGELGRLLNASRCKRSLGRAYGTTDPGPGDSRSRAGNGQR